MALAKGEKRGCYETWTPEDEQQLRWLWPIPTYAILDIALVMGRDFHQVNSKALRLGLPSRREILNAWREDVRRTVAARKARAPGAVAVKAETMLVGADHNG